METMTTQQQQRSSNNAAATAPQQHQLLQLQCGHRCACLTKKLKKKGNIRKKDSPLCSILQFALIERCQFANAQSALRNKNNRGNNLNNCTQQLQRPQTTNGENNKQQTRRSAGSK